jgi:hypothetical protein
MDDVTHNDDREQILRAGLEQLERAMDSFAIASDRGIGTRTARKALMQAALTLGQRCAVTGLDPIRLVDIDR